MQMAPRGIDFLYPLIALFQSVGEHCMACGGVGLGEVGEGGTHCLCQAEDTSLNVTSILISRLRH